MSDKEKLAAWMIYNGFATGHGDSIDDLLEELKWQVGDQAVNDYVRKRWEKIYQELEKSDE